MTNILQKKKRSLQGLWGACTEDRVKTRFGEVFLLDGPTPVVGDPECPEESTRTLWLAPVNVNGTEEYRGRAVFFPVYPKKGGIMVIDPNALNYAYRRKKAVEDAETFMEKRGRG